MNQRNLTFSWLGSILLLAVFAGVSWQEVSLTSDAGGQLIEITGYLAFPIISALILLQAASLLASIFTPIRIGRWIAGALVPVMIIHGILISMGSNEAIQVSLAGAISDVTGVAGSSSQLQLVASSTSTFLWVGYLAATALNLVALCLKAFSRVSPAKATESDNPTEDPFDLWESQK